jgi:hypothetical protein
MLFFKIRRCPENEMMVRALFRTQPTRLSSFPSRRPFYTGLSRQLDSPKPDTLVYPEPTNADHHDLASFLRHAERSGLDPKTTFYVGTHFEYTIVSSLAKYGFQLRRVGGTSDSGIDLLGTWAVPSSPKPLRVLIQCKAIQKPGPYLIRELEGAFIGAPSGWRGSGVLGFLVTEKPATKGIRDALGRSQWPMGFISCSRNGHIQQMLWNHCAEDQGLDGLGVGTRHSPEQDKETHLTLTWKGKHCLTGSGNEGEDFPELTS